MIAKLEAALKMRGVLQMLFRDGNPGEKKKRIFPFCGEL